MAVGRGLLERLSSPDPRRRPDIMAAIVSNLTSLLNTHEGDGFTCPDMGCDFIDLLSQWPTSEVDVLAAVRNTVERYEPRLRNIQVRRIDRESTRIELEITGQLKSEGNTHGRVQFRTEITRTGHNNVG